MLQRASRFTEVFTELALGQNSLYVAMSVYLCVCLSVCAIGWVLEPHGLETSGLKTH